MIELGSHIVIPDEELSAQFFQSAGPGGQNVNKVATAVRLGFDLVHSPSLPENLKSRLAAKLASRLDARGVICVVCRKHRTQLANREEAELRLSELLNEANTVQKPRRATKPTRASVKRRLDAKKQRSQVKSDRRAHSAEE